MNKAIGFLIVGILTVGLFAGCTKAPTEPIKTPDMNQTENNGNASNETSDILNKIVDLLGKKDEQVIESFSEGTPNYIEGSEQIICRELEMSILGEDTTVSINYDDNMLAASASVLLTKTNLEEYRTKMELALGSYNETDKDDNQNEGSGKISYIWNTDKASIILLQAYDAVTVEIMPL